MDLIIVGAGGLGREIYSWVSQTIESKNEHTIKGFIDDNLQALMNLPYSVKVLDTISDYTPEINDSFILAIMNPETKKQISNQLIQKKASFFTFVHPTAIIGTNVTLGKGNIICPYCILTNDIVLGDFVFINTNSTIGHDSTIGHYTSINGKVEITGNSTIGERCLFGVGAVVIPGRRIDNRVTVGAGSVVIRNIKSDKTVFGNPAKYI